MLLKGVIKREILPGVVHLEFPTQKLMASTFLRPQEYYESPRFRGKIFSLEEFKKWYVSEKGRFSYEKDWPGFNIPSSALKPFYEGEFDPLSEEEKEFLELLEGTPEPFYIIGTSKENPPEYMDHELAHALFATDPEYKKEITNMLSAIPSEDMDEFWKMINIGYHESVMRDEIQAHLIANFAELVSEGLSEKKFGSAHKKLLAIYRRRR